MINTLIIGCGKIAGNSFLEDRLTHAGVITNTRNFILKGCFDKNEKKLESFSQLKDQFLIDRSMTSLPSAPINILRSAD